VSLLGLTTAVNTEWPLYSTSSTAFDAYGAYGAGGGYACLRAGYTWIPQIAVTGTDTAKTAGTPNGLRWYRTSPFTTTQTSALAGAFTDNQVCCPALDNTNTAGDITGTYADLVTSHFDTCQPLFTDNGSDTIALVTDVPYVNLANANDANFNTVDTYNSDFILASTWQPAYVAGDDRADTSYCD
jgi:hypothetical protein